jgi:excisionase family DNA binding protein
VALYGLASIQESKEESVSPSGIHRRTNDGVRPVCGNEIPFRQRISCTIAEACIATGLGRAKLYELIKQNRIATVKVGARTLINVGSLVAAFEQPRPNESNASARA